jgi:hypothetical protein
MRDEMKERANNKCTYLTNKSAVCLLSSPVLFLRVLSVAPAGRSDFRLPGSQAFMLEVIKLVAGGADKRLMSRVKSALALIITGLAEWIPVLAFFHTFQVSVSQNIFFKKTLLIEVIPVLAFPERQRGHCLPCARRLTADGEIALPECFTDLQP